MHRGWMDFGGSNDPPKGVANSVHYTLLGMRFLAGAWAAVLAVAIAAGSTVMAAGPGPKLEITAPPELDAAAKTVAALAREDFTEVLTLTGRLGFSEPIRVVLLAEGTEVAQSTPPWVAGYSRGDRRVIVLFPERVPSYPDRTMRSLLRHEVAHVLVDEASRGHAVPRWLNEGVAAVAAREWGLEDRARYAAAVWGRGPRNTRQVDRGFRASASEARRSYALAAGFVRYLRTEFGAHTPARILDGIGQGQTLDVAFFAATGADLRRVERRFFEEKSLVNFWLPFLTSTGALWMAVTLLALLAILRRQARNRAQREAWDEEESEAERASDDPSTTVH